MLELNFNEINLVSKPRYLIGDFIRYHHNVSTLPRKIIINTRNSNEIIELLNKSNIKNKSTNA